MALVDGLCSDCGLENDLESTAQKHLLQCLEVYASTYVRWGTIYSSVSSNEYSSWNIAYYEKSCAEWRWVELKPSSAQPQGYQRILSTQQGHVGTLPWIMLTLQHRNLVETWFTAAHSLYYLMARCLPSTVDIVLLVLCISLCRWSSLRPVFSGYYWPCPYFNYTTVSFQMD